LTKDLEKNPKVIFQHGIFLNLWDWKEVCE
jgi:hypothetical protein